MTKLLPGECQLCDGRFEFPADAAGTTATCPHCGKPTELMLATPPQERTVPVRTIIYTIITIVILVGGLIAAIVALKRAEKLTGGNPTTPAAAPTSPQNQ